METFFVPAKKELKMGQRKKEDRERERGANYQLIDTFDSNCRFLWVRSPS